MFLDFRQSLLSGRAFQIRHVPVLYAVSPRGKLSLQIRVMLYLVQAQSLDEPESNHPLSAHGAFVADGRAQCRVLPSL